MSEASVTMPESEWKRLKNRASAASKERVDKRRAGESAGLERVKKGEVAGGLLEIGGANAPAITALIGGAAIYAIATSRWFSDMEIFKNHWYLRSLAMIALGYYLFRKGSPWGTALMAAGGGLFVQDWKVRPGSTDTKGPEEDAGAVNWSEIPRGKWHELPGVGRVYREEHAGAHMADRVFRNAA
jgi:hypothetical protein